MSPSSESNHQCTLKSVFVFLYIKYETEKETDQLGERDHFLNLFSPRQPVSLEIFVLNLICFEMCPIYGFCAFAGNRWNLQFVCLSQWGVLCVCESYPYSILHSSQLEFSAGAGTYLKVAVLLPSFLMSILWRYFTAKCRERIFVARK